MSSVSHTRTPGTLRLLGALLLGLAAARAAQPAPAAADPATEEAHARTMNEAAETSLREKLAVGQQRYERRLAFRAALVTTMQTQAASREEQILAQIRPEPPAPRPPDGRPGRSLGLLVLLTCCALFGWRAWRRTSA
jgi:hypothetical protein